MSDNSLVFDKSGRVGYVRSGTSGSFTYDDIIKLISSVVDGDTSGYSFVMSPSTLAYCANLKFTDSTYIQDRNAFPDRNPMRQSMAGIPTLTVPFMEPVAGNKMPIMLVKTSEYLGIVKSSQEYVFENRTARQGILTQYDAFTFFGTIMLSSNSARGLQV